ncbi:uncharacterized protein LOC136080254 [Hydra vulgaris]|uniref:ATP-dependent DNA helicase n=1 Tax=Hydra vulgaris TaxID=6087 RepID=A0ABM4BUT9_HYDVU
MSFEDFDLYAEVVEKDLNFDDFLEFVAKSDASGELEKSILHNKKMEPTENDLDFLIESIYKMNLNYPATLEEIRVNAISSRQILCRQYLLNHVKEKCLEVEKCKHYLNECEDCDEYRCSDGESCSFIYCEKCFDQVKIIKKQQKALQWLDDGINFFITGGAGCGKSYIVKEIAQSIQIYKTIHITASTGKAAHLLNGVTIHAFAGIETGVKSVAYYKRHMHADIKKTWLETDVLIINEISMINAQTFNLLHLIACEIKQRYDELFGGIQVIACGDFFQLPPIKEEFVFKSKIWQQYMTEVLVLTECFRQKEDAQFFGALNEKRFGRVSDQTIDYFMTRCFE